MRVSLSRRADAATTMSLLRHEAPQGWPPTELGAQQAGLQAPPPVHGARHGTMHTVCLLAAASQLCCGSSSWLRPASCVTAAAAACRHTTCCSLGMRPRPGLSAWCTIAAGRTAAARIPQSIAALQKSQLSRQPCARHHVLLHVRAHRHMRHQSPASMGNTLSVTQADTRREQTHCGAGGT
jgi:hypothetical protein